MSIPLNLHTESGTTHDFTVTYDRPIILDDKYDWQISFANAQLTYSNYNISASFGNNTLKYYNGTVWTTITIPDGMYIFKQLTAFISGQITTNGDDPTKCAITQNLSTFKVDITLASGYEYDFSVGNFYKLIGHLPGILTGDGYHPAPNVGDMNNGVNQWQIHCDLVTGGFNNGQATDIIYSFVPSVKPGYDMYLYSYYEIGYKVIRNYISQIRVYITSQTGQPINLNGSPFSMTVVLKKQPKY